MESQLQPGRGSAPPRTRQVAAGGATNRLGSEAAGASWPAELVAVLARAGRIVFFTGAGMSTESGIPTFRGPDGLWRRHRPEELATPEAFARNPSLVWEWYDWRRSRVTAAEPHAGHRAIAAIEQMLPATTVITQNTDGLHRRGGSRRVFELHGNILRARCVNDGSVTEDLPVPLGVIPPRCECGSLLRPDVVWFGEALPWDVFDEANLAAEGADVMIVVGTSALVQPAAGLAYAASARGCAVVVVNPEPTPLTSRADFWFEERAASFLPRLAEQLRATTR